MTDTTRILGSSIGLPDLPYHQIDYAQGQQLMVAGGASASFAAAVADTAKSFNEGMVWQQESRSARNTTPTTLENFARDVVQTASARRWPAQTEVAGIAGADLGAQPCDMGTARVTQAHHDERLILHLLTTAK
jgi:hypothetical protein